jgi:hypothetical protein
MKKNDGSDLHFPISRVCLQWITLTSVQRTGKGCLAVCKVFSVHWFPERFSGCHREQHRAEGDCPLNSCCLAYILRNRNRYKTHWQDLGLFFPTVSLVHLLLKHHFISQMHFLLGNKFADLKNVGFKNKRKWFASLALITRIFQTLNLDSILFNLLFYWLLYRTVQVTDKLLL